MEGRGEMERLSRRSALGSPPAESLWRIQLPVEMVCDLVLANRRSLPCISTGILLAPLPRRWLAQPHRVARRRPTLPDRVRLGIRRLRSGTARAGDPAPGNGPRNRGGALPGFQVGGDREVAVGGLLAAPRQGARLARSEKLMGRIGSLCSRTRLPCLCMVIRRSHGSQPYCRRCEGMAYRRATSHAQ